MKKMSSKRVSMVMIVALFLFGATFSYGELPEIVVEHPHFSLGSGPVVAVDQGHNNFHNLDGRFKVFGELAAKDGFNVKPIAEAFTKESLAGINILVCATALDAKNAAIESAETNGWVLSFNQLAPPNFANGLRAQSAYTDDEIKVIKDWVKEGGSLMLVTDHMPFPAASQALAKAFGIIMDNTYAFDEQFLLYAASRGQLGGNKGNYLKFHKNSIGGTDSHGRLYPHKITAGIDYATSFVGGSFRILPGVNFKPLMELGANTLLLYPFNHVAYEKSPQEQLSLPLGQGMLQGATVLYGAGRVAVFAEAAMFSARELDQNGIFNESAPFNKAFTLNTLSWLAEKAAVTCIDLVIRDNSFEFKVPHLNQGGFMFAANFKHDRDLIFKLDKTTLNAADTSANEICLNPDALILPCVNIEGKKYQVTLTSKNTELDEWEVSVPDLVPIE
ncbi:MAG: hypothetical protein HQK77_09575 [Desulfobacterales bacterium]|nr:hypothetical protein [Desulfobacterales bacterium]